MGVARNTSDTISTWNADSWTEIKIKRLTRFLRQVVGTVLIPDAVFDEVVARGRGRPGSSETAAGIWIQRRTISDHEALSQFTVPLHNGEREAILLAEELNAPLLIDEHRSREIALARGLNVIGSLRILREAKERRITKA